MSTGAITGYIDVAQLALYAFWIFFAGLIYYLRREDKREGYPLETERPTRARIEGFPATPGQKAYLTQFEGVQVQTGGAKRSDTLHATPLAAWAGAPLEPTGDPMRDGVGPAAYADRADVPELTFEGDVKIVPLRVAHDFFIERHGPDPRGMRVLGADGLVAGTVREAWVDRSEPQIRYLEVEVSTAEGPKIVMLPMGYVRLRARRGEVRVVSILARHFAHVPSLQKPDEITKREEDRIVAYYAGGYLYAEPSRSEPLL